VSNNPSVINLLPLRRTRILIGPNRDVKSGDETQSSDHGSRATVNQIVASGQVENYGTKVRQCRLTEHEDDKS